jgi:hypothetical protein
MGRKKRNRNYTPQKTIHERILWEMKKMDTQFLTPTKH